MIQKVLMFIIFYFLPLSLDGSEIASLPDISKISDPIIVKTKEVIEKKSKSTIPIVAIAGCSAVGKTEFTKALQQKFKEKEMKTLILKQDDFMNPLETISNYILHPHLDHDKMRMVMKAIKNGESHIKKPKFDWKQKTIVYEDLDLTNAEVILFEGLYVLSGEETYNLLNYSDVRIFMHAQEEDIIEWNWQRENSGKSSHIPRNREKFDKDIEWDMDDYRKNVLPTKIHADFIIEKDRNHNYSLVLE